MGKRKQKQVYVCFDTCTLVDCAFSSRSDTPSDLLVTIFNKMKDCGVKLLAPEVIEAELGAVVERKKRLMDDDIAVIKRSIEDSPSLGTGSKRLLSESVDKTKDSIRSNAEAIEKLIRDRIADESFCERVEFREGEICSAVRLALANAKPSKAKHGDGLLQADCLIVACIGSFIKKHRGSEVVLCSSNTVDFAQKVGEEWQLADSIKACLGAVRYYVKPSDLLKNELNLTDEEEEEIEALDEEYDRVVASSSLADILGIQTAAISEAMKNSIGSQESYMSSMSSIASAFEKYKNIAPRDTYAPVIQALQNAMPDYSSYAANLRASSAFSDIAKTINENTTLSSFGNNAAITDALNSFKGAVAASSLSNNSALAISLNSLKESAAAASFASNTSLKSALADMGDVTLEGDALLSLSDACSELTNEGGSEDTGSLSEREDGDDTAID